MTDWDGKSERRRGDTDVFRVGVLRDLDDHGKRIETLEIHDERRQGQVIVLNGKLDDNTQLTRDILKTLTPMAESWRDQIGFKAVTTSLFRITVGVSAFIMAIGVIVGAALFLTGAFQAKPPAIEAKK